MSFLQQWLFEFTQLWHPYYFIFIGLACVLMFLLGRSSRGMLRFTALMLFLFLLFLISEALLNAADARSAASIFHYGALFTLGIVLIRQVGLCWFRLLLPRVNLHPPRILEELIILLGYVGWTLFLLSDVGLELSSLVTSTAVVTAVLAFAMQDTLGNILSGLALQLDQSICLGDWLEFEGMFGEVVQVQWRHTAIMTRFGEKILIPNSDLMKNRVKIIGGHTVPGRYITLFFYGTYAVPPTEVVEAVQQTLSKTHIEGSLPARPPIVQVMDFEKGQITYALRCWIGEPGRIGAIHSVIWQHLYALYQGNGWYLLASNQELSIVTHRHKQDSLTRTHRHTSQEKLDFLQRVKLLAPLNNEELNQLSTQLKTVYYVRGATLIEQGTAGESMFIVMSGRAAIYVQLQDSKHCVAVLGSGQVFGEMSLMTGEPRQATVIAEENLICYELDKQSFASIIEKRPELAESMAELLSVRAQELEALQDNIHTTSRPLEKQRLLGSIRNWFGL